MGDQEEPVCVEGQEEPGSVDDWEEHGWDNQEEPGSLGNQEGVKHMARHGQVDGPLDIGFGRLVRPLKLGWPGASRLMNLCFTL